MDGITELASLLKQRDNKEYSGPQTGIVISPPPEIKVALGDKIILEKENLIIAEHVLKDYQREVNITGESSETGATGNISLQTSPPSTNYTITDGTINTTTTITGTMKYTNTLAKGDEVILIPSTDNQKYFLIDKAVRL